MPEIDSLLEKIGLPVAYQHFKPYKNKPVPDPPYLVWYVDDGEQFGSDDKNFLKRETVTFEFYSRVKDRNTEQKIEKVLNSYRFDKWEEYDKSEKLFVVSYEFEIISKLED